MTALALLVRAIDFGNPVIHVDEQYYLLVGDRLWSGATPYLDIWDRKPIGLFLLYAAIRALPGDGILAYQLVATGFAATTALIVDRAARRVGASPAGAVAAGAAYLVWLSALGGRGGQSPVFYNLFVAMAALVALHLPLRAAAGRQWAILAWGAFACLLGGIAIQLKYTPAIEGVYIGIVHLVFLRRAGAGWRRVALAGLCWAACGLAPTLGAIVWYRLLGTQAFAAFWFANVTSIGLRAGYPADQLAMRLLGIGAILSPLIASAALGWRRRDWSPETAIAAGWIGAALVGFLAIGTFFDHYALPLLAPLAVTAGEAFGRSPRLGVAMLAIGLAVNGIAWEMRSDDAAGARTVAALVQRNSTGRGCPYVFIGDTITYQLARVCLPTAYAFPNLLAYTTERGATGIDEAAEVRRILANRPPVIVTSDRRLSIWNPASLRLVKAALSADYRPVMATPRSGYRTIVYLRRDLALRR